MTVNFEAYNFSLLVEKIRVHKKQKNEQYSTTEFITKVLLEFGNRYNGTYIILDNQYADDYSPSRQLREFLERLFGFEGWSDYYSLFNQCISGDQYLVVSSANADNIANDLNLDLPEYEEGA